MIHGTTTAYHYGCRCDECKARNTQNAREYRERKKTKPAEWHGKAVHVDADRLRALITIDGRTAEDFCDDAGIPLTTLDRVFLRGSTSESTLDKIACALGLHMSQLSREAM